jgi:hypothetical protein
MMAESLSKLMMVSTMLYSLPADGETTTAMAIWIFSSQEQESPLGSIVTMDRTRFQLSLSWWESNQDLPTGVITTGMATSILSWLEWVRATFP